MEKCDIENLILKKSERISFKAHKDRSEAWSSFNKILLDNKLCNFVKCIDCSSILKYISGHGTGSMVSHLSPARTGLQSRTR
jgi:hypothetical protein